MDNPKTIFVASLVITVSIFASAIMISYALDFVREQKLQAVLIANELSAESFLLEKSFLEENSNTSCQTLHASIQDILNKLQGIREDLNTYRGRSSMKEKDFDYLKRKYFLLELSTYLLVQDWADSCGPEYTPILFFYTIDDRQSERQGYILDDLSKQDGSAVIFSFDLAYPDEPSMNLLKTRFNVTNAPTIIINSKKKEGIVYGAELQELMQSSRLR
ncbi:MAG TPA: hypothetical protein VJB08_03350 [Candidatus Nanoarchaeia archaeon]|nr:hypothetical protein [Candidatus Nanoarchaeia archaeon]